LLLYPNKVNNNERLNKSPTPKTIHSYNVGDNPMKTLHNDDNHHDDVDCDSSVKKRIRLEASPSDHSNGSHEVSDRVSENNKLDASVDENHVPSNVTP